MFKKRGLRSLPSSSPALYKDKNGFAWGNAGVGVGRMEWEKGNRGINFLLIHFKPVLL